MILNCLICNKIYASKSSLCNHNKKYHKNKTTTNISDNVRDISDNVMDKTIQINKIIKCEFCNKIFSSSSTKSEHKKKACKLNPSSNNFVSLSVKNDKFDILEKKNIELENSVRELKELLIKNFKIHPKSLQKKNKNLINNTTNNNIINNDNTTNNTNNLINNTIINKTYVNFYDPIDYKILNEKEILKILSRPWKSLEESIKTIHFNKKLPEYNNIFITNLKDNNAYIFNSTKFCSINKNEALNDLINSHMNEIESSVIDYSEKISENKLKHLNNFIETINDNDKKFIHENLKKTFPNYRIYKCDLIKHLIYNDSDPKLLEKLKNMDLENKKDLALRVED